jgi:hypothetical protein
VDCDGSIAIREGLKRVRRACGDTPPVVLEIVDFRLVEGAPRKSLKGTEKVGSCSYVGRKWEFVLL